MEFPGLVALEVGLHRGPNPLLPGAHGGRARGGPPGRWDKCQENLSKICLRESRSAYGKSASFRGKILTWANPPARTPSPPPLPLYAYQYGGCAAHWPIADVGSPSIEHCRLGLGQRTNCQVRFNITNGMPMPVCHLPSSHTILTKGQIAECAAASCLGCSMHKF